MNRQGLALRLARRLTLIALAGGTLAVGNGCVFVDFAEVVGAPFAPYAAPATPVVVVAAFMQKHGPMVLFQNDTGTPIEVQYWVGRMDVSAPEGVADLRTRGDLLARVAPGESAMSQCGRSGWVTGNSDAVVRMRITPTVVAASADEAASDGVGVFPVAPLETTSYWYALKQPFPAVIRASNAEDGTLIFERVATPTQDQAALPELTPMQPDLWIAGANGQHPVVERP